jgi:pimeloyl-ACP methyl ester carboxylesterase
VQQVISPQFAQEESAQNAVHVEDAFVEVDGVQVHVVRAGVGRPLLLIHGLVGSSCNWRRNIVALAKNASVYAIDMVNMGESERVAGLDSSFAATAVRIVRCMDALGIAEAEVVGHSHGGAISLMLAALYPKRVRSLILFAPANPFSSRSDSLVRFYNSRVGRWFAQRVPRLPSWMHRIALGRMYGDARRIPEGCLAGYTDGLRVPGTIGHILSIVSGWHSEMAKLKDALPRIVSTPTLLLWGDRDRAVDLASGRQLQRILRSSELRIVGGAGHVIFEEMPLESNRMMAEWLEHVSAGGSQTDPVESRRVHPRRQPHSAASVLLIPSNT